MIFGQSRDWGAIFKEESNTKRCEENVTFSLDENVRKIQTFNNDAVVVSTIIANYDVKKILVDNESSIDILFYSTFFQIRLPINRLKKVSIPLVGFTGNAIILEGEIIIPLTAGIKPH